MAQTTWILVANASLARLYENAGPNKGLALMKEIHHPESRQKNGDLVTDRPGQGFGVNGHGGAKSPQTQPKEHEARVFAQELARELNQGRNDNQYKRAILVAPPTMMGLLNDSLDSVTSHLVSDRFEKDYTKSTPSQIASHLQGCIYL
jgi:protein required for attachment to host cells